jgi:uncharacterized membrane protein YphA (DoxX/SURF4 family)
MRYGRYSWSYFFLRVGLGLVFLWIGLDILRHPEAWIGYIPVQLPFGLTRDTALRLNGILDVALGLFFLTDKLPKIAAALATFHLLGILVTQGVNAVLIRDVGLLGMAVALLVWPHHRRKNILTQYLFFWRRPRHREFEE